VSHVDINKCDTTKDKTISCSELGNDVCSTEVGNIRIDDCVWDDNSLLCIKYETCSDLDLSSCDSLNTSLIKDAPCKWIKVYLFKIYVLFYFFCFNHLNKGF
jgi:hypothetical protein